MVKAHAKNNPLCKFWYKFSDLVCLDGEKSERAESLMHANSVRL